MAFSSKDASLVSKQFENHQVQKTYYALVRENPGEGTFDTDVVHQNKRKRVKAVTHYKTIKSVQTSLKYRDFENIQMSLVEAKPETGRWHQLRQHFAGGRFDIIGDTKHGDFTLNRIVADETGERRLMLHAGKLEFAHPHTGEPMVFEAPVPAEFEEVMVYFQQKQVAGEVIMERPKE